MFFGGKYFSICEKHFEKRVFYQMSQLLFKKLATSENFILKSPNFVTIVYNIKRCLRIFTFLNIDRFG
jgi:hypothetical protein